MVDTKGLLFVISAPSGAGKTTLLRQVMKMVPGLVFSVSHTTRKARQGESDGRDYHFVDRENFSEMIGRGLFLEHAEVHGNLYGTSRLSVEEQLAQGRDVILDIDVQGAAIVKKAVLLRAIYIFIAPPSLEELENRLRNRGSENETTIALRLNNARNELRVAAEYDYLVVNDRLEEGLEMLKSIVLAERSRNRRNSDGAPVAGSFTSS